MAIDDTTESILRDRGKRYGSFEGHAAVAQAIKAAMRASKNWHALESYHKESLEMIAHKIGRILNGDPNYQDSWDDIAGYAKLAVEVPSTNHKKPAGVASTGEPRGGIPALLLCSREMPG